MITKDGKYEQCDKPGCEEKIKNHRWARVRANGWFFFKHDTYSGLTHVAYCPDHVPDWVVDWRKKRT